MKKPVLIIASLPPPVTGFANVNLTYARLLTEETRTRVINIGTGRQSGELSHNLQKSLLSLKAAASVVTARLGGYKILYHPVDGGIGQISNILILFFARILFYKIFIHHHSYAYINRKSKITSLLTFISGKKSVHITLCDGMSCDLKRLYRNVRHATAAPNVAEGISNSANGVSRLQSSDDKLTIGILSNLTFEKGIREFVETFDGLISKGLNFEAVLAGPVNDAAEKIYIDSAVHRHKGKLRAIGAIYANDKEQFFKDIDIFLFPTKYKNEAFPLVLIEALSSGVPVISRNRGCICALANVPGVKLVETEDDFVKISLASLVKYYNNRNVLHEDSLHCENRMQEMNLEFRLKREGIIRDISRSLYSLKSNGP